MVKTIHCILLFFLLAASLNSFAQNEKIEQKQEELSLLKAEISRLENDLASKKNEEKKSYSVIENLEKQSFLLNKLINAIKKEERNKQVQINSTKNEIKKTEEEIDQLQENYSKYVVAIYKKGPYNELERIINSESVQQAVLRVQYLKKFSERRQTDLEDLKNKKDELSNLKNKLEKEKSEKVVLAEQKKEEQSGLKSKLNERNKILSSIKKDKKVLLSSLNAKKEAQNKIENLIASLIEEAERKRRETELAGNEGNTDRTTRENNSSAGYEIDLNYPSFVTFTDLKGKMIWPLTKGKIIKQFGENRNRSLNTITLNYGVDIQVKADENVRCVADGVVSAIEWIPGYGNVVIVTHKGDYRTVYSHLDEIFVNEGQIAKTGAVLAVVSEGLEGKILHFEIWKSRDKQNPELWLAKK
jgi:murein hydrolase activator